MIRYTDPHPARPEAVESVERALGVSIPEGFRAHLVTVSNGGYIVPASVRGFDSIGVEGVVGVARSDDLDMGGIARAYTELADVGLLPVAHCTGGTVLAADLENGSIWFYEPEYEVDDPDALTRVANDWDSLLTQTFDQPPLTIKPEFAGPVWVNPEFLRKIQSGEIK